MIYALIGLFSLVLLVTGEFFFLRRLKLRFGQRIDALSKQHEILVRDEAGLNLEMNAVEDTLTEQFLFYDTARKIAPFLDREHLLSTFAQEIKYLGEIQEVLFAQPPAPEGYQKFQFGKSPRDSFYVKTASVQTLSYIPFFAKLLELCSERIKIYNQLQELSIYDILTKVYNRRYFMARFLEEFERAKRLGLSLSFLMIDVDFFKKINDTYGHLVGDVVLRAVAQLIRGSMREMDFVARYGGEEFSVILPETDKAGAIMVAERISSKISREQVKAFDETLNLNVSVGVASYPDNTVHSDVLIEIADKALYKAKLSGRNRVCWF